MSFSKDSKQKLTAIAAVIILLLLATNAVLLYNNYQKSNEITKVSSELSETEKLKDELEKQHYAALDDLDAMKGENEEMNALIENQKEELRKKERKLRSLLSSGKKTKAELEDIRSQINSISLQRDQYLAELNQMKEENQVLLTQNSQLTKEKETLNTQIGEERKMNEELVSAKAVLTSEKEDLTSKNQNLVKTVTRASVIDVRNVNVTGYKVKGSGKQVKRKYAKYVDQLKVCFDAQPNAVTEDAREDFFIRVLNPQGEVLAVESMGSGIMTPAEGAEGMRYTHMKTIDYTSGEENNACFVWKPTDANFSSGTYNVEVYNKGYLSGTNSFTFK